MPSVKVAAPDETPPARPAPPAPAGKVAAPDATPPAPPAPAGKVAAPDETPPARPAPAGKVAAPDETPPARPAPPAPAGKVAAPDETPPAPPAPAGKVAAPDETPPAPPAPPAPAGKVAAPDETPPARPAPPAPAGKVAALDETPPARPAPAGKVAAPDETPPARPAPAGKVAAPDEAVVVAKELDVIQDEKGVSLRIVQIYNLVAKSKTTDSASQELLGRLLSIITSRSLYANPNAANLAYLVAEMLTQQPPKTALAKTILDHFGINPGIRTPGVRVFMGLLVWVYVVGLILILRVHFDLPAEIYKGIETMPLVFAAAFGALGSIVSMMLRINSFEDLRNSEFIVPIIVGFVRPIVGASFASFAYMVISSGLLSVGLPDETKRAFFIFAIAFVSGFSERFVPDLISRVEAQYSRIDGSTRSS